MLRPRTARPADRATRSVPVSAMPKTLGTSEYGSRRACPTIALNCSSTLITIPMAVGEIRPIWSWLPVNPCAHVPDGRRVWMARLALGQ